MKIRRMTAVGVLALFALVGVAAHRIGRARADGVPTMSSLSYGGMLDDGGRPVDGVRSVTVRLWDGAMGGAAVCTTTAPSTQFSAGRFRVALDAACAVAVHANPNLWAEVQVDGATFPRSKLSAVPYALEAGRAAGASGPLEARIVAIEARDGGSGPGPGLRQVVVGSSGSATFTCASGSWGTTSGSIAPPVTMTAAASAIYRISVGLVASSRMAPGTSTNPGIYLRIGGAPSVSFLARPETLLPSIAFSATSANAPFGVTSFALARLESGRMYTFGLEECPPGDGTSLVSFRVVSPIVVEQLN